MRCTIGLTIIAHLYRIDNIHGNGPVLQVKCGNNTKSHECYYSGRYGLKMVMLSGGARERGEMSAVFEFILMGRCYMVAVYEETKFQQHNMLEQYVSNLRYLQVLL